VAHSPHFGDRVHDEAVQGGLTGGGDLGRPIPQRPTFVVDGKVGICQGGKALEQEGPILLC